MFWPPWDLELAGRLLRRKGSGRRTSRPPSTFLLLSVTKSVSCYSLLLRFRQNRCLLISFISVLDKISVSWNDLFLVLMGENKREVNKKKYKINNNYGKGKETVLGRLRFHWHGIPEDELVRLFFIRFLRLELTTLQTKESQGNLPWQLRLGFLELWK